MTEPTSADTPPYAPLRRRVWLWVAAAVVIGLCILIPLVYLQTIPRRAAVWPQQREHFLRLGTVLRQYAEHNEGALPDELTAAAAPWSEQGDAMEADSLLRDLATDRPIVYRVLTPSGERLRYEPYGDRIIAWTDPDERGRRIVLFNNLEEVAPAADSDLDQHEQRIRSTAGLNRVHDLQTADDAAAAEDDDELPPGTAPAGSM